MIKPKNSNIVLKSLNVFFKKRELERIEMENVRFARRLLEKPGSLSVKEMDQDFEHHLKYMQRASRMEMKK